MSRSLYRRSHHASRRKSGSDTLGVLSPQPLDRTGPLPEEIHAFPRRLAEKTGHILEKRGSHGRKLTALFAGSSPAPAYLRLRSKGRQAPIANIDSTAGSGITWGIPSPEADDP